MVYREWIVEKTVMNSDWGYSGNISSQKKKKTTLYSGQWSINIMCGREHEEVVTTLDILSLSVLI